MEDRSPFRLDSRPKAKEDYSKKKQLTETVSLGSTDPRGASSPGFQFGVVEHPRVWQRKRHGTSELIVSFANRGVAGAPGIFWLQVQTADACWQLRGALDPGHPCGGGNRECSFLLPQGYAGVVHLPAQLEIRQGVMKSISWACEQEPKADGSINVDVTPPNDPAWRWGV